MGNFLFKTKKKKKKRFSEVNEMFPCGEKSVRSFDRLHPWKKQVCELHSGGER